MLPQDAGLPDPSREKNPPLRREKGPVIGRVDPLHAQRAATLLPPGASPPGLSAAPDIFALLGGLRRRWVSWILLGGLLAGLTAVGVWFLLAPEQVALARIRVTYDLNHFGRNKSTTPHDFKTYLQTKAGEITSQTIIRSALKRDEVRQLGLENVASDPVSYIEERLKTEFKDNSELLDIKMSSSDAVIALTVVNAIREAYLDDIVYTDRNARVRRFNDLEKAYTDSTELLKGKRNNLQTLARNMGTNEPTIWQQQRQEALMTLRDARLQQSQVGYKLVEARAGLDALDLKMKFAAEGTVLGARKPTAYEIEQAVDSDAEARQMEKRLDRLQNLLSDYEDRGAGNFPTAIQTRSRLAEVRNQLARRRAVVVSKLEKSFSSPTPATPSGRDETPLVRATLSKQIDALEKIERDLGSDIQRLVKLVSQSPRVAEDYIALDSQIKLDEKLLEELGTRVEREKLELKTPPRVSRFGDQAELVRKDNKKQLLATLAGPLAIFAAVGLALAFLDFRQRRIRYANQVSQGLGIRVVGAVPAVANLERQLVGPAGESILDGHPVLESIDAVRTHLLHEADARQTRVLMVTSATAGEGKSTLAAHLAISLARAGRKTLLLDGDLRRPSIHELFEIPMQPGFSETLLGEIEVQDAWQPTGLRELCVMPSGQWDREVLQCLASGALEAVLDKLGQEFDFIIIDSHPVLAATDSLMLGRRVDAVLLSVLREVSQLPKVYTAAQRLAGFNVRVLGAVVNGTDPDEVLAANPAMAAA